MGYEFHTVSFIAFSEMRNNFIIHLKNQIIMSTKKNKFSIYIYVVITIIVCTRLQFHRSERLSETGSRHGSPRCRLVWHHERP